MTARSKARKRALDVLYAAEARGVDPLIVLDERMQEPSGPDRHSWTPIGDYAEGLVRVGVQSAVVRPEAAALIRKLMAERNMPAPPIDRTILSVCVVALCQGTSP